MSGSIFSAIINILCQIAGFLIGPWAWVLGVIAIGMGGLALALEEGKMAKLVGTVMIGIGFVVAAPKLMDTFFPSAMNNVCTNVSR